MEPFSGLWIRTVQEKKIGERRVHFNSHSCTVDLKVAVPIINEAIHGKNHANEGVNNASGNEFVSHRNNPHHRNDLRHRNDPQSPPK